VIFLDYNLNSTNNKAKDGLSILKEIKRLQPKIEVVMFSGQEKIEVAVNSVTHGAFDYIVKSESAFLRSENVVKNILKRHTLLKENKFYKKLTTVLIVVVALMVIGAFGAYALGYISDAQVGGDIVG
ncbi:MAG TPA: response regulator, partial [Cytophaga sp.]|nr:response regulator [Cytophaga sp.]